MNKIKNFTLLALMGIAYSLPAQMVVTNPTQDFILLESKIETASSWVQQLDGLRQTIEVARQQAAKLDSTKRAMEKTYQLQEDVRRDASNAYNAVKKMSWDNLAHVGQSYLGFSINPKDYLPDMPGLEGYSEFRQAVDYNPGRNIAGNTAAIDRFLSSVVLTDSSAIIDNPTYSYFRRLDQINNLAGAYGSFYLYRTKAAHDQRIIEIARMQSLIDLYNSMRDSVKSVAEIIALNNAILVEYERINALREKAKAEAQELVDAAARVANIQDIVAEKTTDIVIITAAISTHYNLNKNFSLRKLAKEPRNKAAYDKVRQQSRQDMQNMRSRR